MCRSHKPEAKIGSLDPTDRPKRCIIAIGSLDVDMSAANLRQRRNNQARPRLR